MRAISTTLACVAALFLAASLFGHTVTLRLLLLALGIVLSSIAIARRAGGLQVVPPIVLPFALWAAWAALSITWSEEPALSIKEFRNEVWYTAAALWICFIGAQSRHARTIFLCIVGVSAVAACVVALRNFSISWQDYLFGRHGGPGDHSSALLLLVPCAAMTGWYLRETGAARWQRILPVFITLLFLVSSYYTLNRTIWLGLAVEALLIGAVLLRRKRLVEDAPLSVRNKAVACTMAALVVSAGLALTLHVQAERESTVDLTNPNRDSRIRVWRETTEWVARKPLTGYGFGRGMLREELRAKLGARNLWHAHNFFLDSALQTGVPGLLLFLLIVAVLIRAGWRLAHAADPGVAACGMALLGVVAGMVVRNMTDTILVRQNALLFWGTVGVLLAWGNAWRAHDPSAHFLRKCPGNGETSPSGLADGWRRGPP